MDLDAYLEAHAADWIELEQLVQLRQVTPAQADRLIELYQRVGTHLSVVRSTSPDPELVAALSNLLARARRRTAVARVNTWKTLTTFFVDTFPAVLYRLRRWWIIVTLASLAVTVAMALRLVQHPELETQVASSQAIKDLVNHDFEAYYSESAASHFALQVWTNNALVTMLCVAMGILGLPVLYLLWDNLANLGLIAGLMINHGKADVFFGLILPHGLLELTAVFVAGGAGLKLFWSWVAPGDRSRIDSLAHEGRSTLTISLGLIAVLLVSGVIEAFVTPSPLPTAVRVGIGVVAWAAFLYYALVWGRAAFRRGADGDVGVADRGEEQIARG